MVTPQRVVGIDAAGKHGWVGVVLADSRYAAACVGSLAEIIRWAEPVDVVAVDIPVGSVSSGRRSADVEARRFLGPRASSVFAAPPPQVHTASTYGEANEILVGMGAPKLSRQTWALVPKVVEAGAVARADDRIYEVHPEVSFCEIAGEPVPWSKKSWNGLMFRRRLLESVGIVVPDVVPEVAAAADDVLDATVAAWSARRIALGSARSFPDPPEESGGRRMAIWC